LEPDHHGDDAKWRGCDGGGDRGKGRKKDRKKERKKERGEAGRTDRKKVRST
jgi:hypothetical protein